MFSANFFSKLYLALLASRLAILDTLRHTRVRYQKFVIRKIYQSDNDNTFSHFEPMPLKERAWYRIAALISLHKICRGLHNTVHHYYNKNCKNNVHVEKCAFSQMYAVTHLLLR